MQEEGTLNVLQAIALANGTMLTAKTSDIHVFAGTSKAQSLILHCPTRS